MNLPVGFNFIPSVVHPLYHNLIQGDNSWVYSPPPFFWLLNGFPGKAARASVHGLDEAAQGTDEHVGSLLEPGDLRRRNPPPLARHPQHAAFGPTSSISCRTARHCASLHLRGAPPLARSRVRESPACRRGRSPHIKEETEEKPSTARYRARGAATPRALVRRPLAGVTVVALSRIVLGCGLFSKGLSRASPTETGGRS